MHEAGVTSWTLTRLCGDSALGEILVNILDSTLPRSTLLEAPSNLDKEISLRRHQQRGGCYANDYIGWTSASKADLKKILLLQALS
jgi:hypothetical protein